MALAEKEITIRGTKYKFVLIGGMQALKALQRITGKMSALIPNLITKNPDKVNEDFYNLITDEFDNLFDTFIDVHQMRYKGKGDKDYKMIGDIEEHFSGQPTALVELLYKVILENDRDFFLSLPTLINKGLTKLNASLPASSLQMPEGLEKTMTNVAQSLKENLG